MKPTRFRLPRERAIRLASYVESVNEHSASRTDHWHRFGDLSTVRVDAAVSEVEFRAGAGFDSDFERNFRTTRLQELRSELLHRLMGRSTLVRYRKAFASLWREDPPVSLDAAREILGKPLSPHKILAAHYANRLLPHLGHGRGTRYLEIGAGSGYLAALMFRLRAARLLIVDLPEIIPYSFLYLTGRYPEATFVLPNELARSRSEPPPDFLFLAPDQLANVPNASIDIAVNTASFGEMLPEQIGEYFRFLRRVAAPEGLFFTVNRIEKWMSREAGSPDQSVPGRGIPVRFDEYPWATGDRDLYFARSDFHDIVQPNPMLARLCVLERTLTPSASA